MGLACTFLKTRGKDTKTQADSQKLGILLHQDLGHSGGCWAPGAKAQSSGVQTPRRRVGARGRGPERRPLPQTPAPTLSAKLNGTQILSRSNDREDKSSGYSHVCLHVSMSSTAGTGALGPPFPVRLADDSAGAGGGAHSDGDKGCGKSRPGLGTAHGITNALPQEKVLQSLGRGGRGRFPEAGGEAWPVPETTAQDQTAQSNAAGNRPRPARPPRGTEPCP